MTILSILIVVFIELLIYFGGMALVDRLAPDESAHRKNMLDRISGNVGESLLKGDTSNPLARFILQQPGMLTIHGLLQRAGYGSRQGMALLIMLGALLAITYIVASGTPSQYKIYAFPVALVLTYMATTGFLRKRVEKRKLIFIDQFPEALDMMVRSVKSGYPMNSALQMVVDNMGPPVSTEFRQMVEEVAYGRPLSEALKRLAHRVDQTDVKFFTVVLIVQQETGGNLSEVLANLSGILRKRKQLRMKIKALTSEGRVTMWIMAGLPVVLFGILSILAPEHLEPLYTIDAGRVILGTAIGLVIVGITIVKQMIKVDI